MIVFRLREIDSENMLTSSRAVFAKAPIHEKGNANTANTGSGPHDPVGEAFSLDKPFVKEKNSWGIEHGSADGIENTLCQDQVPDALREGRDDER